MKMTRCHIPIITNNKVDFWIGNPKQHKYNLKQASLYYLRTGDKTHWVRNNSNEDRIHMVIDMKPTAEMINRLQIYNDYTFVRKEWKNYTVWKEFNKNSDTLYISFSGLGINWKPTFIFYNTLSKTKFSKLFIRDTTCQWYLNGIPGCSTDVPSTVKYIQKKINESNCTNVIMLGCSAGGFGALLYGILLNVDKIITFNPQTYLD